MAETAESFRYNVAILCSYKIKHKNAGSSSICGFKEGRQGASVFLGEPLRCWVLQYFGIVSAEFRES